MTSSTLRRGFVLHRRDYRNTSLLVELFCADEGRVGTVAKGAKAAPRGRSAQAALLQPFQPLWLAWTGRGELKTLTRVEAAEQALPLADRRLYCGFYLNELLLRLLARHDPHEALFVFYQQALADLVSAEVESVLRRFELRLLEELGYAPDLRKDAAGTPVVSWRVYQYVHEVGLIAQPEAADGAFSPVQGEVLVPGDALGALASGASLSGAEARALRALMRAALAPLLGSRPLKSRELFRRLANLPISSP